MKRLLLIALTLLLWQVRPSFASTIINVDSASDAPDIDPNDGFCGDNNGDCGLRAAVMEANAQSGADTINLPANTYNVNSLIAVTDSVTIIGNGATTTIIDRLNGGLLFDVTSTQVTFRHVTLQNAHSSANGGALRTNNDSANQIVLENVIVKNNRADFNGGGMYVLGGLTIRNSIIEGNQATFRGGGFLANLSGSLTTIEDSIIRQNTAGTDGGGFQASRVQVFHSTIHNNTAGSSGGGIFATQSGPLSQITVSSNTADKGGGIYLSSQADIVMNGVTITNNEGLSRGGGIYNNGGEVAFRNSIIAGNFGTDPDCHGESGSIFNSAAYNLIGLVTANCPITGDTTGNLFHTTNPPLDPQLGLLQINAGTTPTQLPNMGSPAVNAANPSGCHNGNPFIEFFTDQQGVIREQQGRCDMGSAESSHGTPTAVGLSEQSTVNSQQWVGWSGLLLLIVSIGLLKNNREVIVMFKRW